MSSLNQSAGQSPASTSSEVDPRGPGDSPSLGSQIADLARCIRRAGTLAQGGMGYLEVFKGCQIDRDELCDLFDMIWSEVGEAQVVLRRLTASAVQTPAEGGPQ